jgi:ATPase subunit of ABC transporter with duplicated ATPase domains
MAAQYAFVMKDLRKIVPPKREILKGIFLSFYHGAKIGVLGNNGAGKSTLLKIMAGVDKEFVGEAAPAPGDAHRLPAAGAAARRHARTCAATSRTAWPTSASSSPTSRRSR